MSDIETSHDPIALQLTEIQWLIEAQLNQLVQARDRCEQLENAAVLVLSIWGAWRTSNFDELAAAMALLEAALKDAPEPVGGR